MKIYCDTCTLFNNVKKAAFNNVKEAAELLALECLLKAHQMGTIDMYRSLVDLREVMRTRNPVQRQKLIADYKALQTIPNDERLRGFHTQTDQYGGCISYPLVSDVQDEAIFRVLEARGLELRDAQHIAQAISNNCDVFLTRDCETIIRPHGHWIEQRFPTLNISLPSELVTQLKALGWLP